MFKKTDIIYYLELQRTFEDILLYVSMHEDNFGTFSVKIENLFVSACSFLDSLCQTFIIANKESGKKFTGESQVPNFLKKSEAREYFNINDYQRIFQSEYDISKYEINLNCHSEHFVGNPIFFINQENREVNFCLIKPFENWDNSINPDWWKDFTSLKHNRLHNTKLGNLKNLTYALAATFIILSIKNEDTFKNALIDKEIYNVFFPNYWKVKGINTSRGNISFK
ncbi:hypothetical protein [Sunxiuqinia sp. sy24]|uniref:hypothetical protein n=1 Tax=Sunxiuqinia sp. sy24 TaxID=3461495 RepID=UPI0040466358